MKIIPILTGLLIGGLLYAQTTPPQGIRWKTPDTRAFVNARIVVAPGQIIPNGTLVIKEGKVLDIGSGITPPAGATVIDLSGKTIYPGFIDPYTSYGLSTDITGNRGGGWGDNRGPQYDIDRVGGNAWNGSIHAEKNWIEQFKPNHDDAEALLKQGITVTQSARMDGVFRGRSFVTIVGDGLPNYLVIRPRSLQFASFNKGTSRQEYPSSLMGSIALLRQTFYDVDWYKKAASAYAANPGQPRPEFNAPIEALGATLNEPIIFDSEDDESLLRAQAVAKEFGRSFIHLGSGSEYQILPRLKPLNAALILPVNFPKTPTVKTPEDELDVSLAQLRHWETAPSNPAILDSNGIRFAFTSYGLKDKGEYLKNIRRAIKRGLPADKALAALTTVPAEYCGISGTAGTLDKGKLADFIITDKSIFDDDAKIYATYAAGVDHQFIPFDQQDFRGDYALRLANKDFTLSLVGDITRITGTLKSPTDTLHRAALQDVSVESDKLFFNVPLDSLGVVGTGRFAARLKGDVLVGRGELADAIPFDFAAPRSATFVPKADSAKKHDDTSPLVARRTFPDMAFGVDGLPKRENVLFKNATVWTSDDAGTLQNADVLVIDGKIAGVGKDLKAPGNCQVIDATGKHITPGIIDEHSHIAIANGVNEGSHAVTAEVRIGDVTDPEDINIYRALAGGVTITHCLHGSANPIGGQCQVIKLKWGGYADDMRLAAAAPTIKFALGENVKQSNWGEQFNTRYPQSRMGVETIMKDAFQAAREYEADWKKFHALKPADQTKVVPPRRDIQMDALVEVLNGQRFIHCHSYVATEILMLMRLAEEFGFKVGTFTHILEGYKVADEMAKHGASANSFADWWDYKFEVYDAIPENTCLMQDRGVIVGINSDSPETGRRLNQEAAKSIKYCGMSEEDALKMVTINPAIQLKIQDKVGSLKVGKDADFVVWNNNPLSIYAKPEQTWIEGAKYFDIQKDLAMRDADRKEKGRLIQRALQSDDGGGGADFRRGQPIWHCEDVGDVWQQINSRGEE